MTYRYIFAEDRVLAIKNKSKADAQVIGEELERIRMLNAGELRTKDAVEAAKDPRNVLHQHLEWDNIEAGYRWRLKQMRSLINSVVRITSNGEEKQIPAFVSIRTDEHGVSYRETSEVLRSTHLRKRLLEQALGEAEAYRRRYSRFEELAQAAEVLTKVAKKLIDREKKS